MKPNLVDRFGRTLDYLRISLTDRCNFRCKYCMPPEGIRLIEKSKILSFEEIIKVAKNFLALGGKRIRLTGGEPLLRKNIEELVSNLAELKPELDLALTTNGTLLEPLLPSFKKAGLKRINISLDSLQEKRFAEVTFSTEFQKVLAAIFASLEYGFITKVNVVAMHGLTQEEMRNFAELAYNYPLEVRFIEFMPLCGTGWHPEWSLPIKAVRETIQETYHLRPLARGTEVAQSYQLQGGKGTLGFIASMTEHFCDSCSRLRLSADGKLHPCLFSKKEIDIKTALRKQASDRELQEIIAHAVKQKPAGHEYRDNPLAYQQQLPQMPHIRSIGG